MEKNKINIFVTGGTGLLGKDILFDLSKSRKYNMVCLYRKNDKVLAKGDNIKWIKGDLLKLSDKCINEINKSDVILHLAAKVGMFEKDCLKVNVDGTKNVLNVLNKNKKIKFIFFSSIDAFGLTGAKMADEEERAHPITPYGKSKLLAEEEIIKYSKSNNKFNYAILRLGNVIGVKPNLLDQLNKIAFNNSVKNKILRNIFGDCELSVVDIKVIRKVLKTIIESNSHVSVTRFLSGENVSINFLLKKKSKKNYIYKTIGSLIILVMKLLKRGGFYYYLGMKDGDNNKRRFS